MTGKTIFIQGFAGFSAPLLPGFLPLEESALKQTRERFSLRRADRFTTLAVMATAAAAPDADGETALITASAFGPHRTTFATLDDILDFAEDEILPTKFSHSVHNAAASYLGVVLGLRGPVLAVTGFEMVWFEAMELAATLLASEMAPQVLVVAAEEKALLTERAEAFYPGKFPGPFTEGAAALLLSSREGDNHFGSLVVDRDRNGGRSGFAFGLELDFWNGLTAGAVPENCHVLGMPAVVPAG